MNRSVDIVRAVVKSALGNSLEQTVAALKANKVGIRQPLSLEQAPKFPVNVGEMPTTEDRHLGAARAEELLHDALTDLLTKDDLESMRTSPTRWGMIVGTTLSGMRHCGAAMRAEIAGNAAEADKSYARTTASWVLSRTIGNLPLCGPTMTVSCACASGLVAISHACTLLESGALDFVIAGGYDPIGEFVYAGFSALQLLASRPTSPFAADRDGMSIGEGVALCLLRRAGDPGDNNSLGTIIATGEASDAHHLTQPQPQGASTARVLRQVGVDIAPPDLLIAHATGTPNNDIAEYHALQSVFGKQLSSVPVLALKGRFGHPLGAAGALDLLSTLACIQRGFVPTTAGRGRDRQTFADLNLREGEATSGLQRDPESKALSNLPKDAPGQAMHNLPRDIIAVAAGFGGANAAIRVVRFGQTPAARPSEFSSVFITGSGCVSSAGRGVEALRNAIIGGKFGGPFNDEVLAPLLDSAKTRRLSLLARLTIGAVRDLCASKIIPPDTLKNIPLIAATWYGAVDYTEHYYRDLVLSGIDLANPLLFAESVPNIGSAQTSIACGIEAAAMSVFGRRTSGLEALLLAKTRIMTGEWERAIVVAADEAHPIVNRLIETCCGKPVTTSSLAIAFLLERAAVESEQGLQIHAVHGCTAPLNLMNRVRPGLQTAQTPTLISNSPIDAMVTQPKDAHILRCGELGSVSALAAIACAQTFGIGPWKATSVDPQGACWSAEIG